MCLINPVLPDTFLHNILAIFIFTNVILPAFLVANLFEHFIRCLWAVFLLSLLLSHLGCFSFVYFS